MSTVLKPFLNPVPGIDLYTMVNPHASMIFQISVAIGAPGINGQLSVGRMKLTFVQVLAKINP
jgi:hypothetical protein